MSGERVFEGNPVGGAAVGREHELDRQLEQGRNPSAICSRVTPAGSHSTGISRHWPKSTSVSPAITARWLSIHKTRSLGSLPASASTPTGSRSPAAYRCACPLSRHPTRRHQGYPRLGRREDRQAKSLHEATRVALVPWARQHHHRLAAGGEGLDLVRNAQRIEEQQTLVVPDRVRRDDPRAASFGVPDIDARRSRSASFSGPAQSGCGASHHQTPVFTSRIEGCYARLRAKAAKPSPRFDPDRLPALSQSPFRRSRASELSATASSTRLRVYFEASETAQPVPGTSGRN